MANETDSDLISALSSMLGVDDEEIINKIAATDVNTMLAVIDAVKDGDSAKVAELMQDTGEIEGEDQDKTDVDAVKPDPLNPLLRKVSTKSSDKKASDEEVQVEEGSDEHYQPTIGHDVLVGKQRGTVKIPRGPHNTVGVMIDGELTMVGKNEIRKVNESVMGMTMMGDLNRMKQLAGIRGEEEVEGPPAPEAAPVETPTAVAPAAPVTPASVPAPATPVVSLDVAPEADGCTPYARIENAFDSIEEALPDMKFADVKSVRERLNKLLMKLNESAARPRKR